MKRIQRIVSILMMVLVFTTSIPCLPVEAATPNKVTISSILKTGTTTAKISWKAVNNADGYEVYSKTGSGKYTRVKITDSTSAVISKLSSKKKYSFKVRAFSINSKGSITYGKFSSVKSCDMTCPAMVSVKSVKQNADNSVTITWKKQTGVSGFYVYRKTTQSGSFKKISTVKGTSKTSYKDTKVQANKTYYYAVKAFKGKKVSANYSTIKKISLSYQDTNENYGEVGMDPHVLYCNISGAVVDSTEKALFTIYFETKPVQQVSLFRNNENLVEMRDDGANGDEVAGDGIYSATVQISSSKEETFSFFATYGTGKSNVLEVKVYNKVSEAEVEQTGEEAIIILAAADQYTNSEGFVSEASYIEAINAVYEIAMQYKEKGIVKEVSKSDTCVIFSFSNGLKYVYQPKLEGVDAVGSDVTVSILSMQPWKEGYETTRDKETATLDLQCTDGASQKIADSFDNYAWNINLDNEAVTLDTIKNLSCNQVVLWHGHGGYDKQTGPFILTGEDFKIEYLNDWIAGRVVAAGDGKVCFTSAFVNKYVSDCSNSFIYLACCESGRNASLANAFLDKGATAVVANTNTINTKYNCRMESAVVDGLLSIDENSKYYFTLGQSLTYAKSIYGPYDNLVNKAEAVIFGDGTYRFSDDCKAKLELDQIDINLDVGNTATINAITDGDESALMWSSSDPSVVKVDSTGSVAKLTGLKAGEAEISCSIGNVTVSCLAKIENSLSLYPTSVSGKEGGTYYLLADTKSTSVTWKSSDPSVVSVTKLTSRIGKATFKKAGEATITCSTGNQSATCEVKVTGVSVSLDKTKLSLSVGGSSVLTATSSESSVTWKSSNTSIVTVTRKSNKQATVKAKKAGSATIYCYAGKKLATCKVTVSSKNMLSISISKKVLKKGEKITLTAISNLDTVKWTQSGAGKVTLSSDSKKIITITGKTSGIVTLKCSAGGKTVTCLISVVEALEDGYYTSLLTGTVNKTATSSWGETYPSAFAFGIYPALGTFTIYGSYAQISNSGFDGERGSSVAYGTYDLALANDVKIYFGTYEEVWDDDTFEDEDIGYDEDEDSSDLEYDDSTGEEDNDEIVIDYVPWTQSQFESYYSLDGEYYESYIGEKMKNRGVTIRISDGKVVEIFCWEYCNTNN